MPKEGGREAIINQLLGQAPKNSQKTEKRIKELEETPV